MRLLRALAGLSMLVAATAAAPPPPALPGAASFADLAVLTLGAPVIVRATVTGSRPIAAADAPGLAPGTARLLVTAAVSGAITAPGDVPAQIDYLADLRADARGRPPKLKGADVLLFLRSAGGGYALSNAHGQLGWSADAAAAVRRILTEAKGDVPVVTGVGNAFRVPGAVEGEAESQFFLTTASAKPVSLVVLTRPGQPQQLEVATGDVIDEAAKGVAKDTLLWFRLACGLPPTLSGEAAADGALVADYAFVRTTLGPCGRTLP